MKSSSINGVNKPDMNNDEIGDDYLKSRPTMMHRGHAERGFRTQSFDNNDEDQDYYHRYPEYPQAHYGYPHHYDPHYIADDNSSKGDYQSKGVPPVAHAAYYPQHIPHHQYSIYPHYPYYYPNYHVAASSTRPYYPHQPVHPMHPVQHYPNPRFRSSSDFDVYKQPVNPDQSKPPVQDGPYPENESKRPVEKLLTARSKTLMVKDEETQADLDTTQPLNNNINNNNNNNQQQRFTKAVVYSIRKPDSKKDQNKEIIAIVREDSKDPKVTKIDILKDEPKSNANKPVELKSSESMASLPTNEEPITKTTATNVAAAPSAQPKYVVLSNNSYDKYPTAAIRNAITPLQAIPANQDASYTIASQPLAYQDPSNPGIFYLTQDPSQTQALPVIQQPSGYQLLPQPQSRMSAQPVKVQPVYVRAMQQPGQQQPIYVAQPGDKPPPKVIYIEKQPPKSQKVNNNDNDKEKKEESGDQRKPWKTLVHHYSK